MGYTNFRKNDRREVISGGLFEREITWDHEYIVIEQKKIAIHHAEYTTFLLKLSGGLKKNLTMTVIHSKVNKHLRNPRCQ